MVALNGEMSPVASAWMHIHSSRGSGGDARSVLGFDIAHYYVVGGGDKFPRRPSLVQERSGSSSEVGSDLDVRDELQHRMTRQRLIFLHGTNMGLSWAPSVSTREEERVHCRHASLSWPAEDDPYGSAFKISVVKKVAISTNELALMSVRVRLGRIRQDGKYAR
jgi:hypothetical protein